MKIRGLLAVTLFGGTAFAACGGTVVFEEDGGEGGSGAGQTTTGVNTGPNGPSSGTAGDGGSGPGPTTTTTQNGPISVTTVGPGPGPGPTTTTGPGGCGSFGENLGFTPQCNNCMDNNCCEQLLACDEGTPCFDCVFVGECSPRGEQAINSFVECYSAFCQQQCERSPCDEGDFQCGSGECVPGFAQCDGFFDCQDGSDEEFCGEEGICDSGVSSGDFEIDSCLGDFCCFEFEQCSNFGQDVGACFDCLEQGGGPLCDEALFCAENSPCFGGPSGGICDSGVETGDGDLDQCLGEFCCFEFEQCSDFGADIDGCNACLQDGGGPQCDDAIACATQSPCLGGNEGICQSGLTSGDPGVDQCLSEFCCDEFMFCTADGTDPNGCVDCFNNGGGPLCDGAIACAQEQCGF